MNLSFQKIATVGSTGLIPGRIYFETTTGCIKVAKTESTVDVFGAGVKSAELIEDGKKLKIVNQNGEVLTADFSDVASASAVTAELNKKLNIGTSADASSVQSYYGLKKHTDEAKAGAISSAKSYTDSKFDSIPAAIEYKGDGTTITEVKGDGDVTFSVGTIDQSKVTGLSAALTTKADKVHTHTSAQITDLQGKLDAKADASHTHAIADLTDLNSGWDALLKAAPDVAKDTELTALESRVGTAESKLSGIEAGAQVNKIESIKIGSSPLAISGKAVTIPNAAESTYGVISEGKVKELATAVASTIAGSVYRVKGTKATIGEVLAVESAEIGDTYNVTAEFTLNSKKYPAGTNVVFVGPASAGEPDPTSQAQWDALGGTVDLTPYETTAHASSTYATKSELTSGLNGKVPTSRTVNNKPLSANVVLGGADIIVGGTSTQKAATIAVAIKALEDSIADAAASGVTSLNGKTGAVTIASGSANGSISVGGVDVSVKGLGSMAYATKEDYVTAVEFDDVNAQVQTLNGEVSTIKTTYITKTAADKAYDVKGSANTALTQAKTYADGL